MTQAEIEKVNKAENTKTVIKFNYLETNIEQTKAGESGRAT